VDALRLNAKMQAELQATQRPVRRASTLPTWTYTSPSWYEREVERIFFREWLCVGFVDQLRNPGDYFTVELLGEPILVVRDKERAIRAFSSICRHRGTPVVQGEGNCRVFQCPYHNWTYALNGELVATPGRPRPMDDVEDFDHRAYGLVPFNVDTWAGMVFLNFDRDAAPLRSWLGGLPEFVGNYRLEQTCLVRRKSYDLACNWKTFMETVVETYHAETVHKKFIDSAYAGSWAIVDCDGPFEALYGKSIDAERESRLPVIEGLNPQQLGGSYYIWLQPNLAIGLHPTLVRCFLILPTGPETMTYVASWCYPADAVRMSDFKELTEPMYPDSDEVDREDIFISELAQRGYRSRFCSPGRYSPREELVHRFALYIIGRVQGDLVSSRAAESR
jgi:choline monooxygenase